MKWPSTEEEPKNCWWNLGSGVLCSTKKARVIKTGKDLEEA